MSKTVTRVRACFEKRGWLAACVSGVVLLGASTAKSAEFNIAAFDGQVAANAAGDAFTQAGGHPFSASTTFEVSTITHPVFGADWPAEPMKNIAVHLPPGFVGNPTGVAQCTLAQLVPPGAGVPSACPIASQVGVAAIKTSIGFGSLVINPLSVYNMVPPPNAPARFGFVVAGVPVMLDAGVRSATDYGVTLSVKNVSQGIAVSGSSVTIWGVPSDPVHDPERQCPGTLDTGCSSQAPARPVLRNPTACSPDEHQGLVTSLDADSWFSPGVVKSKSFVSHLPPAYTLENPIPEDQWGPTQGTTSCDRVPFAPRFEASPGSPASAGKPSSFSFDLTLPQTDLPDAIGTSDLRKTTVTLPEGVRISPSAATGLGACSASQIALASTGDPTCPDASKIGTLRIETPLLEKPLSGSVYLGMPRDNPFQTLLSLYLVAKGPGVILKLPGKVETDPVTGQLKATFDDNPQLPFSKLHVEFSGGPRASLVLPAICGVHTTRAVLTSWSGKTIVSDSSFTISSGPDGAPCQAATFKPDFIAGTENPVAGASSPFRLLLSREDHEQEFRALSIDWPQGLLARIADVALCPEVQAVAGTCGEASRVGSVTVGAGAGITPFFINTGRAYLGGPYKGAPFSLSVVVPAIAGPFDLGTVVVRAAIYVNRRTAAVHIVSDPLPTILEGIPLQVRTVRIVVDREGFTLNPTSCRKKHIRAAVGSTAGAVANVAAHFQVGECNALALKPKMTLAVGGKGHTRAGLSTPLTATLRQTPGQSNLKSVQVTLPLTLNALLPVVNNACTRAEFDAGQCEDARAGSAVVNTPLLRDPLRGGVYFVKAPTGKGGLPNLVVALRGQVDFDLIGKITIPGGTRLSTTFDAVPDVPVRSFVLRLVAGKKGAVGIAENLCTPMSLRATAQIDFEGQNGKRRSVHQALRIAGCGKAGKRSHGQKSGERRR